MLEGEIGDPSDRFVGGISVGLDDNGTTFLARDIELRSQIIDRNLLIPKINRRPVCNTDDLVFHLWSEHKFREWNVDGYSRLQDKIRAQQQKKKHEKDDVEQRKNQEPPELIFFRSDQFHLFVLLPSASHAGEACPPCLASAPQTKISRRPHYMIFERHRGLLNTIVTSRGATRAECFRHSV